MRATLLLLTLISGGTYAAGFGCTNETDQRARLACYDQLAEAIAQCAGQNDQLDRLLCYDQFSEVAGRPVSPAPAPQTAAPAKAPAPAPAAVANASPEAAFGLAKPRAETIDTITSPIAKVSKDPYGQWTITLANGQRWRQTESRSYKVKSGQLVTIERAALGSFLLSVEGRGGTTRVKRVD